VAISTAMRCVISFLHTPLLLTEIFSKPYAFWPFGVHFPKGCPLRGHCLPAPPHWRPGRAAQRPG